MRSLPSILAALAMSVSAAHAGDLAMHAAQAEYHLAQGDAKTALAEFEAAQELIWSQMPLMIRKVDHSAGAESLGVYAPRSNRYAPGEKLSLYLEPVGYAYGNDGLGNNVIELAVDAVVFSASGEEIGAVDNFGRVRLSSRAKNRELYFGLKLALDPELFPSGSYRADFVLRDLNSEKTAPFSIDFEIEG